MRIGRISVLAAACIAAWSTASLRPRAAESSALTRLNRAFLLTPDEAQQWHAAKDAMGPALSGNASWKNFIGIVEARLREYGAVDVSRNAWTYDRWSTTQWPDDSGWTLTSGRKKVRVASYGRTRARRRPMV